jgi:cytochrome P450
MSETDRTPINAFDLAQPPIGFIENPYPFYARLRDEAPIKRMSDGSALLSRHADLEAVYKRPDAFISDKKIEFVPKFGVGTPLYEHHTTSLVFNDRPLHTRVRKLIAAALTPRAIIALEPELIGLVDILLDAMESKGTADLIEDFAAAIPIEVIGNMLNVPHTERGPLRRWSLAILGALEPAPNKCLLETGNSAVLEFMDYLKALISERRRNPLDPAQDILTRLIGEDAQGDRLTESELLHQCIFLLNAGHETTTNLIGNGLVLLAEKPKSRTALLENPELIKSAVEECLRYESSNQLGNRRCVQTTEISGERIEAGTPITLCIGAANRDPRAFADPERFDITRHPNRHLAFGTGIHQCVGMNVARIEGAVAIGRFVKRFPKFIINAAPTRSRRIRFRGFIEIPCNLGVA